MQVSTLRPVLLILGYVQVHNKEILVIEVQYSELLWVAAERERVPRAGE